MSGPKLSLQQNAYEEARRFDDKLNSLLELYPPTNIENYLFWKVFTRTVQTGLNIINEHIDGVKAIYEEQKRLESLMKELKENC